jgi:hypothetical protein
MVTEEEATSSIPCRPDVDPFVESIREYLAAGYDHLLPPDRSRPGRLLPLLVRSPTAGTGSIRDHERDEQMPNRRPSVKNEKPYEALKDKRMSTERPARIANSPGASSRGGEQRESHPSRLAPPPRRRRLAARVARRRPASRSQGDRCED